MNVEATTPDEGTRTQARGFEGGLDEVQLPNLLEEGARRIRALARKHPYATVLGAAGVGYVLGGGLPRWAARALLRGGTRRFGTQLLTSVLTEIVADGGAGPRSSEPTLVHEEEP